MPFRLLQNKNTPTVSNPQEPPHKKLDFLGLPAELREQIYIYLFSTNKTQSRLLNIPPYVRPHPILLTCKQIASEATGLFYHHSTFETCHLSRLSLLIRNLNPIHLFWLREIRIHEMDSDWNFRTTQRYLKQVEESICKGSGLREGVVRMPFALQDGSGDLDWMTYGESREKYDEVPNGIGVRKTDGGVEEEEGHREPWRALPAPPTNGE